MADRLTDEMRAEMRTAATNMVGVGLPTSERLQKACTAANVLALLDEIDELRREAETAKAIAGFEAMRYENEKKDNAALRAEMKEMAAALEPVVASFLCSSGPVDQYGYYRINGVALEGAARIFTAYRERNP